MAELSNTDNFIARTELAEIAARLQRENDAVAASFKERPLTTQYQVECDARRTKITAIDNTIAFLAANGG